MGEASMQIGFLAGLAKVRTSFNRRVTKPDLEGIK